MKMKYRYKMYVEGVKSDIGRWEDDGDALIRATIKANIIKTADAVSHARKKKVWIIDHAKDECIYMKEYKEGT